MRYMVYLLSQIHLVVMTMNGLCMKMATDVFYTNVTMNQMRFSTKESVTMYSTTPCVRIHLERGFFFNKMVLVNVPKLLKNVQKNLECLMISLIKIQFVVIMENGFLRVIMIMNFFMIIHVEVQMSHFLWI